MFGFFIVTLQERLEKINEALRSEYECRRRMLMKRLDVTVQSFGWSDRAKVSLLYFLLPVGGSLLQFPRSFQRKCTPCKYTSITAVFFPTSFSSQVVTSKSSILRKGKGLTRWHSPSFVTVYSCTVVNFTILCWVSHFNKFTSPLFLSYIHPFQSSTLGGNLSISYADARGGQTLGLNIDWVQRVTAHKVSEITVTANLCWIESY